MHFDKLSANGFGVVRAMLGCSPPSPGGGILGERIGERVA